MITEETAIDKIEVMPESGTVQVRQVTRIMKDGEQIATTYTRWSLAKDQDVSDQSPEVQAVCKTVWSTPANVKRKK